MISTVQDFDHDLLDNPPGLPPERERKMLELVCRIRELEEILKHQLHELDLNSETPPLGFTRETWPQALDNFNRKLQGCRHLFSRKAELDDVNETACKDLDDFMIRYGPEWDLKIARQELDRLLQLMVVVE